MKSTALCVALLCALLLLPLVSASLSVGDVSLNTDQAVRRSNPLLTRSDSLLDDSSELSYVSFSIPVTATGQNETVTRVTPNLGFVYDSFGNNLNSSVEYYVDTPMPMSVQAGQTSYISLRVLVPSNLNAIDGSFNPIQQKISATLQTTDGQKTSQLSFYAENGLQLRKVTVTLADGTSFSCKVTQGTDNLDCPNDADNLPLNKNFDVTFSLRNSLSRNSRIDFRSADISVDSDNGDVDPSDTSFSEDVNAGDTQDITDTFDVSDSVQNGDDTTISIQSTVTDDNGAMHGFVHHFRLEFNAKSYEINTPALTLNPTSVCPGDNSVLTYNLENLGSHQQTNVRPTLTIDAFALNKVLPTVSLDETGRSGDSYRGTTTISVPSTARAGTYPVSFLVYYRDENSNDASLLQTASLVVQNCQNGVPVNQYNNYPNSGNSGSSSNSNSQGQNTSTVTIVQPGQSTSGSTGGQTVPTTSTNVPVRAVVSSSSDTPFIIGLVVGVIVLLVVLGLLVAALVRK